MAFDTLRSNKMRSALTVLGVVIGVTSIVGMTSLIRGFDTSLRNSINSLGPNTIFVQRFGGLSFSSGASFMRADAAAADHRRTTCYAIERLATTVGMVDIWLGGGGPPDRRHGAHVLPRPADAAGRRSWARPRSYVEINFAKMHAGRSFTEQEVQRAPQRGRDRLRAVRGALRRSRGIDPIGKQIRVGGVEYTVLGVVGKRPSPGGAMNLGQDDFAIVPYTAFRKQFGSERIRAAARSAASRR